MWLLTHSACLVSSFVPGLAVGRPAGGAGLAASQEIHRGDQPANKAWRCLACVGLSELSGKADQRGRPQRQVDLGQSGDRFEGFPEINQHRK